MIEGGRGPLPGRLFFNTRVSLTWRILAVNLIVLVLIAGSLFYLDSYRNQLLSERFQRAQAEAEIVADALVGASRRERRELLARIGSDQKLRLRYYDAKGKLTADSFALAGPSFAFVDPAGEPWYQHAARRLDRGMDWLLGTPPIPFYREPEIDSAEAWSEVKRARANRASVVLNRYAPDRTPVISAAVPVGMKGDVVMATRNAPDVTQNVRDARQTLAIIVGAALIVSVLLSLFLARTIVKPLRSLVRSAVRVRLGRDREVIVPRLPDRRDEIGLLARAISDMTAALRQRIDAVEAFAADVAHEIKNPLTSLRSALESIDKVEDPALRRQLAAIAEHDVRRIDRLITEIADASRIDAELSRTTFEPVDMVKLVEALVGERESRGVNQSHPITVSRHAPGEIIVPGDAARLVRVLENLLDNAVSFSPAGAAIDVDLTRDDEGGIAIAVSDHGPGIPEDVRERVFERFHSLRPPGEDFGSHSGLGLAIARTIVEAHYGRLTAESRLDGAEGARLLIELPAWEEA